MPNWDDIRSLLALAEHRSFAAAGRALGVQHTTIARRVAELEDELGVVLIKRTPTGIQLTEAGERALPHARAAATAIEALLLATRGEVGRVEGAVRLAVSEATSGFLVRRLGALKQSHPALDIHLLASNRPYDLTRGEADIALRFMPTTDQTLKVRKVGEAGWGLYATASYLASRPRPSGPDDLGKHALIGFDESLRNVPGAVWLREQGLDEGVVLRTNSLPSALNAALAGLGVAVLPCLVAVDEPLLEPLFEQAIASPTFWLVTHPDVARAAKVRVVIDFLIALLARDRNLIERPIRRPLP